MKFLFTINTNKNIFNLNLRIYGYFISKLCLLILIPLFFVTKSHSSTLYNENSAVPFAKFNEIYKDAALEGVVGKNVFFKAMQEYIRTQHKKEILTIIDYSKHSFENRFYVIDIKNKKLLYNTLSSHGKNSKNSSDFSIADKFSNKIDSKQSSLGLFITGETYMGKNGYSLKIDGLNPGVNDNARKRYIVVHGANYSEPYFLDKWGMIGTSHGCPTVPKKLAKSIINTIKGGSLIYSYHN